MYSCSCIEIYWHKTRSLICNISGKTLEKKWKSSSLNLLRNWLLKHGITHVAMESTGVYWKPIFNILGDHFQILLVNPRHTNNVPGRKMDMNDSQWLAKLLIAGLLKWFHPEQEHSGTA